MNKLTLCFVIGLSVFNQTFAGNQPIKKNGWILPGALIGLGLVAQQQGIKDFQSEVYHRSFHDFHTSVDDFLQYSPTIMNIGLSIANPNQKTRNAKIGRFVLGSISYVLVTQGLKRTINELRPNGGAHSFPSGHTATAFFGAHLLAKETSHERPWLGYVGYGLASATGILRMANNEHWLSDVLVGAGIGIGAAEVAHLLYPVLEQKWAEKQAIRMRPIIGNQLYGVQLTWNINPK